MITEILKKTVRILMIFSIILTICVIFYNSSVPPEESIQQSNAVKDHMADMIPPKDDSTATDSDEDSRGDSIVGFFDIGAFIQDNIRNIAHFMEYGLSLIHI